jgi:Secretion system C-terminal sorting domain
MLNKYGFMNKPIIYFFTVIWVVLSGNNFAQQGPVKHDVAAGITIFPNPAPGGYFIIKNESCSYEHFDRLLIFNSNGVLLQNNQLQMYKGTSKQHIDISGLTPGNYFIRIVDIKDPDFSFASQLFVN